jgi:hypothetical protein
MHLPLHHFCGNKDAIFIYLLHVSGPTAMHIFNVTLVLLLEQHAILLTHINLLIVHAKTAHSLLRLVVVIQHVMIR